MAHFKKLVTPITSAAVAMIVLTAMAIVFVVQNDRLSTEQMFKIVWPIALTSSVAVILVMSLLYQSLSELMQKLAKSEKDAKHIALHDDLTGLCNRKLLIDRVEQSLRQIKRGGRQGALLAFDLDKFKLINDTFGHNAGDGLIKEVSRRLVSRLREVDTVARIGGDEFAIWLSDTSNAGGVEKVCEEILADVADVVQIDGQEAHVSASIGAVRSISSDTVTELLVKADIAMYEAKAAGRGCFKIFTKGMETAVKRRQLIERKLKCVLENKDDKSLDVHFQPVLKRDQSIVGIEGLLRWDDQHLGSISPDEVIPIAEDCGLIDKIGEFVIDKACVAAQHFPDILISVNLSPSQFRDKNLAWRIEEQVKLNGVRCDQIELEITESLLLEHGEARGETLAQLRDAGFKIALDDFGTGYSSLNYLHKFQVDTVKLDRSFIQSAKHDKSIAILRATVSLGHAINLRVAAEGIENSEQEQIAMNAGCDVFQGNYYAPPMAAGELVNFVLKHKKRSSFAA